MRVGVIGGTFDPIHVGHLIMAEGARDVLDLQRVVFVPAGQPPHKRSRRISPAVHRLAMARLAIAGNACFTTSRVDIDREGPSYTVDTIRLLQEAWGPDVRVYFLIGGDSLAELPTWHQPERLIEICQVVAVPRPGSEPDLDALNDKIHGASERVQILHLPLVDLSATEIRDRVMDGRSIRYLVPDTVEQYIYRHRLYREQTVRQGGGGQRVCGKSVRG
jgi:nicotinate-nucleotide adenylyltransferase